jgi:hypothetical protein
MVSRRTLERSVNAPEVDELIHTRFVDILSDVRCCQQGATKAEMLSLRTAHANVVVSIQVSDLRPTVAPHHRLTAMSQRPESEIAINQLHRTLGCLKMGLSMCFGRSPRAMRFPCRELDQGYISQWGLAVALR